MIRKRNEHCYVPKPERSRNKKRGLYTKQDFQYDAAEDVIEAMQQRMRQHPDKAALRKTLVEHPFGTIKHWTASVG